MPDVQNKKPTKIALLGGDLRQLAAKEALEGLGYLVALYGFDTYGCHRSLSLEEALDGAAILLFPVPVLRNERLNLPFTEEKLPLSSLMERLSPHLATVTAAFGGVLPDGLAEALTARGIAVYDLCREERFNILNSVPTAEGAIAIAMNHLNVTVCGASVCVTGFGRIGKTLCRLLRALGAHVTAVSRKEGDRALSELYGCRACDYKTLPAYAGEFDVIFNTVPETVITEPCLAELKKDAFVIDLASKPGGVDMDAAAWLDRRVIWALALPGKVAPLTAGARIRDTVYNILREAGI